MTTLKKFVRFIRKFNRLLDVPSYRVCLCRYLDPIPFYKRFLYKYRYIRDFTKFKKFTARLSRYVRSNLGKLEMSRIQVFHQFNLNNQVTSCRSYITDGKILRVRLTSHYKSTRLKIEYQDGSDIDSMEFNKSFNDLEFLEIIKSAQVIKFLKDYGK